MLQQTNGEKLALIHGDQHFMVSRFNVSLYPKKFMMYLTTQINQKTAQKNNLRRSQFFKIRGGGRVRRVMIMITCSMFFVMASLNNCNNNFDWAQTENYRVTFSCCEQLWKPSSLSVYWWCICCVWRQKFILRSVFICLNFLGKFG